MSLIKLRSFNLRSDKKANIRLGGKVYVQEITFYSFGIYYDI